MSYKATIISECSLPVAGLLSLRQCQQDFDPCSIIEVITDIGTVLASVNRAFSDVRRSSGSLNLDAAAKCETFRTDRLNDIAVGNLTLPLCRAGECAMNTYNVCNSSRTDTSCVFSHVRPQFCVSRVSPQSRLADYMFGFFQCTERLSRPSAQGQKDLEVSVWKGIQAGVWRWSWELSLKPSEELGVRKSSIHLWWTDSSEVVNSPFVD